MLETTIASGFTTHNLEAATYRIIDETYKEKIDTTVENTSNKKNYNNWKIVAIELVIALIVIAIIIITHTIPMLENKHAMNMMNQENIAMSHQDNETNQNILNNSCTSQIKGQYSGKQATLKSVAMIYHKASERAIECSRRTNKQEEKAEFLLLAANNASLECDIETNYDHNKAEKTYEQAISLAKHAQVLSHNHSTISEATEIIRQLKNTPQEIAPKNINANS